MPVITLIFFFDGNGNTNGNGNGNGNGNETRIKATFLYYNVVIVIVMIILTLLAIYETSLNKFPYNISKLYEFCFLIIPQIIVRRTSNFAFVIS